MKKVGIKGLLKIAKDSEDMFDFNDSLSEVIHEEYETSTQELNDTQLTFAMGGKKDPEVEKKKKEEKNN